jgi:hypothetical protein
MLSLTMSIGPVMTELQTDERMSFDGIETLMTRINQAILISFHAHLAALVQYENYDADVECDECDQSADKELD